MAGNIVINNVFSEATLTEAAKVQQNFSQMEDEFANLTHFAPLVVQTDHIENDQINDQAMFDIADASEGHHIITKGFMDNASSDPYAYAQLHIDTPVMGKPLEGSLSSPDKVLIWDYSKWFYSFNEGDNESGRSLGNTSPKEEPYWSQWGDTQIVDPESILQAPKSSFLDIRFNAAPTAVVREVICRVHVGPTSESVEASMTNYDGNHDGRNGTEAQMVLRLSTQSPSQSPKYMTGRALVPKDWYYAIEFYREIVGTDQLLLDTEFELNFTLVEIG